MSSFSDPDVIERLAAILMANGLSEIEVTEGESRLRLARAVVAPAPAPAGASPPGHDAAKSSEHPDELPPPAGTVPSPMVGIAYLSAEPGTAPLVSIGQTVSAGQTLLLIEAMKTFNQVKAPRAGTVKQILVSSGQPVEYGQPLMVIA